jgi:hypothetical protein
MSDERISEQYRLAAEKWVDADAAARMLEEARSAVRSQKMLAMGDIAVNRAQLMVEGSREWHDYLKKMVDAKTLANKLRIEVEYLRMRAAEQQSEEASKRAEMRL